MSGAVYSVNSEDEIDKALQAMQEHKIRRLPVVNVEGELEGILSINDLVRHANVDEGEDVIDFGEVMKTYHAICEHPVPMAASAAPGA